jgi:hypothetical protein
MYVGGDLFSGGLETEVDERSMAVSCPTTKGVASISENAASRRHQLPDIAITWEMNVCSKESGKPRIS